MLQVLEKKDGESLKNFMDVTEGADGRMVIGIIQSLDDTKRIQDLTFKITFVVEIATILVNMWGLFTHRSYCGLITFPIALAAFVFSRIVRREILEYLDFIKQGFGWEEVEVNGNHATVTVRGRVLDVDVIRVNNLDGDMLDVAGRKLYIKEE